MSSSSSSPSYGSPYDPWGNYNVNGGWIGPKHASPSVENGCCDPFDPGSGCYECDSTDPTSECYVDNCDPSDPNSGCYYPGAPEDLGGSGGSGNPGSVKYPRPIVPPGSTTNTLNGEAARIREGSGQLSMVENDLALGEDPLYDPSLYSNSENYDYDNSDFPWGQTRSYANIEGPDEGGINGNRWLNKELGYLDFLGAAPGVANPDRIVRSGLANESIWFEKDSSTNLYSPLTAFYGQLLHENDTFVYSNEHGMQWIYFDNSLSHPAEMRGKLKSLRTAYGITTDVEYDVNDELEAVSMETNSFSYEYYDDLEHIGMLKSITQGVAGNGYRKVEYQYYSSGEANGNQNDLKKATISGNLNGDSDAGYYSDSSSSGGGTWVVLRENYYRYYKDGEANGFKHGLKYVLRAKAYYRMLEAGIDPETASDSDIATYADYRFEYDASRRVTKQVARGGEDVFTYSYEVNPDEPGLEEKNTWDTKTTITDPDGTERRVYTNPTSSVLVTIFDDKTGTNESFNAMERNSDGWTSQRAYPTAISNVIEPSGGSTTLTVNYNADGGLIYEFDYYTTDDPAQGKVKGRPEGSSVKEGSGGVPNLLEKTEWAVQSVGGADVYPILKKIKYPEGGAGTPSTYDVTRTYYKDDAGNDTLQVEKEVMKPPLVPVNQNGDGVQHEIITYFDKKGGKTWRKDARGFITHWQYGADGKLSRRIDDVNTEVVEGVPDGWVTPTGGGLNYQYDFERDASGRILRGFGPWNWVVLHESDEKAINVRGVDFFVYRPDLGEEWSAVGYATGSAPAYGFETVGAVTITRRDEDKRVTDVIAAVRECSCGTLKEVEEFPQSSWEGWTKHFYDDWGRLLVRRVYHNIPKIGEGKKGEHYGETKYSYNSMGLRVRQVSPGGTISRAVYDSRKLLTSSWVGTDDTGATDNDPTGGGASGNNMVKVLDLEYDNGNFNGNGLLTKETRPVDDVAANDQITEYSYDYRTWLDEIITNDGNKDYITKYTYSNYGQITEQDTYHTSVAAGNLTSQMKSYFDSQGRVYRDENFGVNPVTGAVGNALRSETWRDANGNRIKGLGQGSEAFTKAVFDGLNRPIENYFAYNPGTSSNDNDVSNDVVVEQTETAYNVKGKVTSSTLYRRFDDATGNGRLNGPNGAQPKARRSFSAAWYDGVHRTVADANFGTNGGADFTRPSTVPDRSDTVLVTSYRYLTDGEADATIDPMGIERRWEKDAAGRVVVSIDNFDPSEPTQDYGVNRITAFGYNLDGQQETLTLVNKVTGDQITRWVYGTKLSDSKVARNDLLRAKIYPESNDDDDPLGNGSLGVYERIEYEYDRQGSQTQMKDPNGTIHEYDYDKMGRQTQDRITTFAATIDDTVKRIASEFDDRGLPHKVTSYDDATVGSGNVINQVEYGYDDFGNLTEDKQSHSGAADGSTPKVAFSYENGSSGNTARMKSVTYPNGRVIDLGYGATDSGDDLMSRVTSLKINGEANNLVDYSFFGIGALAKSNFPEPSIDLSFVKTASQPLGDGGDPYTGYDRFGRVVDLRWVSSGSESVKDRFQYGYDRSSRRTWKANLAATPGDNQDEHYLYDGLSQVTSASRGELNINRTAVGAIPASEETFTYDPTGNWDRYQEKSDGTIELDQSRINNKDNQVTQFDGVSGNAEYDLVGNTTKMPPDKTGNWSKYYQLKWDGWNRLIEVKDSENNALATFAYDGTTRRTIKTIGSEVRHYYYNNWKSIEERINASSEAEVQSVWDAKSRNNLILRDRDTTGNGTLDERLYSTNDVMSSGTAVLDNSGDVLERYRYTAFGVRSIMEPGFSSRSSSSYDWEFAFHGEFIDGETGYVNYGYRYYSPFNGRWLSRDPIAEMGGINLYFFVGNNSTNWVDVLGLRKCNGTTKFRITTPIQAGPGGYRMRARREVQDGGQIAPRNRRDESGRPYQEANFQVDIEFKKPDCGCCAYRQQVRFSSDYGERPKGAHDSDGFDIDYGWDDVTDSRWQYGDRGGRQTAQNGYGADGQGGYDAENGCTYHCEDSPWRPFKGGGSLEFKIEVIDTCNDEAVIESRIFALHWN